MLNLFFIVIIILHGNVAVDDISAFYLPHFTFFMSFKDVFSPLCLSHCKKKNSQKRRKKINKMSRRKTKNYRENSGSKTKKNNNVRFSRSLWFKPISAKAIERNC